MLGKFYTAAFECLDGGVDAVAEEMDGRLETLISGAIFWVPQMA